jgi:cytochrome c oxidase assembly protein subunit 15
MGCPDWPKCFGRWVPPTSVAALPDNYKAIYSAHREKKNQRFASYLRAFGFRETADKLLDDPSILLENDFNAVKTWIEYINRLVGVVIGFLIFAVFIVSRRFWNSEPRLTVVSSITFILVGFQGWIGSVVVSTNLTPWTITVHMLLALVIVALLVYLVHRTHSEPEIFSQGAFWWLVGSMVTLLIQVILGTQVREMIDQLATTLPREEWIPNAGVAFLVHRSFSWVPLALHVGLMLKLRKTEGAKAFVLTLLLLILGTLLTGAAMAYFAVPPLFQPIHLLLATVTFGMQFLFLLKLRKNQKTVAT